MNFMNLGPMEMVIIGVVALVVVGPRKLPELGRMVGRWMKVVREASDEMRRGLYYEDTYRPPAKPRPTPSITVSEQSSRNQEAPDPTTDSPTSAASTDIPGGDTSQETSEDPVNRASENGAAKVAAGTTNSAEYRDAYPYGQDGMD